METLGSVSYTHLDVYKRQSMHRMAKRWIQTKSLRFDEALVKTELTELINLCKKQYERFVVDNLAETARHTERRLSPYHCHLNPIEMIWSHIRDNVARSNKMFEYPDM